MRSDDLLPGMCTAYTDQGRMGIARCGNKAKEDGLCGVHLAARRKIAENERKRVEARDAEQRLLDATDVKIAVLASLGIAATPHWSSVRQKHTGKIVVDPDELLTALGLA